MAHSLPDEPEELTELEILEERVQDLVKLSVRPESEAARECRNFITIVMSTFAPPALVVVMKAMLTFPEMQRTSVKDLSDTMGLDRKQTRDLLNRLKALGYVVETTGMTEWAQKTQHIESRYRGSGKEALYHLDYKHFMMMTHFRLYQILKRLDVKEGDEDDTGYVCINASCYLVYKIFKIMDLIAVHPMKRKSTMQHFTCSECREPLVDAQKFWNDQNAKLTKKMKFNRQIRSLRTLLTSIQDNIHREGVAMSNQIRKLEDQMERIKEGPEFGGYRALTLKQSGGRIESGGSGRTGLAHLDRIGRRVTFSKNFECQIEEDVDGEKLGETEQGENEEDTKKKEMERKREAARWERRVSATMREMLPYELGMRGKQEVEEENVDLSRLDAVRLLVNDRLVPLVEILQNQSKFESEMTTRQFIRYQEVLDAAGLLEVE